MTEESKTTGLPAGEAPHPSPHRGCTAGRFGSLSLLWYCEVATSNGKGIQWQTSSTHLTEQTHGSLTGWTTTIQHSSTDSSQESHGRSPHVAYSSSVSRTGHTLHTMCSLVYQSLSVARLSAHFSRCGHATKSQHFATRGDGHTRHTLTRV
jgi:hypothetical protein